MAQYTSNDGKLLLDILYRINQTEDIVSFGKTALFLFAHIAIFPLACSFR